MNNKKIEGLIRELLIEIGENPDREGLVDTPKRIARMYEEIFQGYNQEKFPKVTFFQNGKDGIKYHDLAIDSGYYFSHCEHHGVPFFGTWNFGYVPGDKIIGISKIARVVDYFSARLQVSERLVYDIVDWFEKNLKPEGLILIMTGRHLCKEMRGVKKNNTPFEVISVKGVFERNDNGIKTEFFSRIGRTHE